MENRVVPHKNLADYSSNYLNAKKTGFSSVRSCFRQWGGRWGISINRLSSLRSGALCKPWKDQIIVEPLDHPEIVGGHNYCRNPAGEEQMEEPWCFTTDRTNPKQVSPCLCHKHRPHQPKSRLEKFKFHSKVFQMLIFSSWRASRLPFIFLIFCLDLSLPVLFIPSFHRVQRNLNSVRS